jgi:FAD/FMN-containing dehydrogenase/Fe-S oxidoreductase
MTTSLRVLQRRRHTDRHLTEPTEYKTPASAGVDAAALARELSGRIRGEVRFDDGSRALYATDGSNYRQVPIGVVVPRDERDVIATVSTCRAHGAPILSRGCGTSLAGQCCNVAVVIDFTKYMHDLLEIDSDRKLARVHPGIVCQDLRSAAERYHLTFGPDPATHRWCTIGGMCGNNSCGVHSQMAGRTADNIHELDVLLYDGTRMRVGKTSDDELASIIRAGGRRGEIYGKLKALRDKYADLIRKRYPKIPRRVSGYNLDELLPENGFHVARSLVGSEGTCVVILEAVTNLVHSPPGRTLVVFGYPDVFTAGDHVTEIGKHKFVVGLEALGRRFITDLQKKHLQLEHIKLFPKGGGYLLVEVAGETDEESADNARRLMDEIKRQPNAPDMKLFTEKAEEEQVWHVRESGLGATAHVPGEEENWEGWEDSAVPPEKVGDYLRDLKKLFDRYGYVGCLYGHFGQGCIHTRINFGLKTADGVKKFRDFITEASDLVVSYGGSLSGEHGDGQSRAEMLPKMFGPELVRAFEEFKAIWDPDWKMNPGKVVRPYRIDENLRYGPHYNPPQPETHFKFAGDGGFARAMERCVGVGKCRREEGGTMCPSYMVTREETHTTRGRARLLFEMLQGDVLHEGWRSDAVHDALDLCLACKGCKGDCPVHVDMATYKAEFLSHYYERRLRPRHAYAFGWVHLWARLAGIAPTLANVVSQTPIVRDVFKWVIGMSPKRRVPAFAPESFKSWFARRRPRNATGSPVVLWPDTFNNYFHADTAKAATEVLEDAGFRVIVPQQDMCCGRPLYDYGFLGMAERWLRQILDTMAPEIEAGVPFVVLEPSCGAVFRDELMNLLPDEVNAQRLSKQTFLLSEFLSKHTPHYELPKLTRKALVHGHCHHRAIMSLDAEDDVLHKLGVNYDVVDSGCCGMAGAFGFERGEHYDVSIKCGERVLLPAVREAARDEVIIANGFSCREQIAQTTDREALHLAQVIQLAKQADSSGAAGGVPENSLRRARAAENRRAALHTAAYAGAGVVAGVLLYRLVRGANERSLS